MSDHITETNGSIKLLGTNTKLLKKSGKRYAIRGLTLAPHAIDGFNVCPQSTLGCRASCVLWFTGLVYWPHGYAAGARGDDTAKAILACRSRSIRNATPERDCQFQAIVQSKATNASNTAQRCFRSRLVTYFEDVSGGRFLRLHESDSEVDGSNMANEL